MPALIHRQQRYWEAHHPEVARPECKKPSCKQFRLSYFFLPLLPRIGGWESAGHFVLRTKASPPGSCCPLFLVAAASWVLLPLLLVHAVLPCPRCRCPALPALPTLWLPRPALPCLPCPA